MAGASSELKHIALAFLGFRGDKLNFRLLISHSKMYIYKKIQGEFFFKFFYSASKVARVRLARKRSVEATKSRKNATRHTRIQTKTREEILPKFLKPRSFSKCPQRGSSGATGRIRGFGDGVARGW